MTQQEPQKAWASWTSKKKAAVIGGGVFALLASCGIGAGMGGSAEEVAKPAVTTTVTERETVETTITETETETPTRAQTTTAEPVTTEAEEAPRVQRLVPTTESVPEPEAGGSAYYANCAAARAAGAAPLYRGSPGYSSSLDRDGDGVACE
ncbi:excalibur calcium-binding domain-containing protein [Gordonia caeni]|uniref:Excalibur calcium-binding domain-containing protein n=1 Tax=Gordonia caeni TaxID=1007097 RepID=A0ABP7PC61_9ACTN